MRISSVRLSPRELKLLSILLISLLAAASILSVSRWIEQYTSLNREIEQKTALLQKASFNTTYINSNTENSSERNSLEGLEQNAERLKEKLDAFTSEENSGSYGFGEELLELTGRYSITVRRYRPLSESGFTFTGSGSPENVIRLLADISHSHAAWQFSGLHLTGSSRPGELDIQFDLHNLSLRESDSEEEKEQKDKDQKNREIRQ